MQTNYRLANYYLAYIGIGSLFWMVCTTSSAQLSFSSGVNPSAGPDDNYAAVEYFDFSNAGSGGEFATGTQNNLYGTDFLSWVPQTYSFTYTYDPAGSSSGTDLITAHEGVGCSIAIPNQPPGELQILDKNTGIGNLTLTLTSINSVADGVVSMAPNSIWTAANGASLRAYLDSPTLFSSGFTLNGTITLDSPANGANYGDNLNSLINISLAPTPEPSTGLLFGVGLAVAACLRRKRQVS